MVIWSWSHFYDYKHFAQSTRVLATHCHEYVRAVKIKPVLEKAWEGTLNCVLYPGLSQSHVDSGSLCFSCEILNLSVISVDFFTFDMHGFPCFDNYMNVDVNQLYICFRLLNVWTVMLWLWRRPMDSSRNASSPVSSPPGTIRMPPLYRLSYFSPKVITLACSKNFLEKIKIKTQKYFISFCERNVRKAFEDLLLYFGLFLFVIYAGLCIFVSQYSEKSVCLLPRRCQPLFLVRESGIFAGNHCWQLLKAREYSTCVLHWPRLKRGSGGYQLPPT